MNARAGSRHQLSRHGASQTKLPGTARSFRPRLPLSHSTFGEWRSRLRCCGCGCVPLLLTAFESSQNNVHKLESWLVIHVVCGWSTGAWCCPRAVHRLLSLYHRVPAASHCNMRVRAPGRAPHEHAFTALHALAGLFSVLRTRVAHVLAPGVCFVRTVSRVLLCLSRRSGLCACALSWDGLLLVHAGVVQ